MKPGLALPLSGLTVGAIFCLGAHATALVQTPYPIVIHQRLSCVERLRDESYLFVKTLRRSDKEVVTAALERFGVRSNTHGVDLGIEAYIERYLAAQRRFFLANQAFHHPLSRQGRLIAHMLMTLRTGQPTAPTRVARCFLRWFYPATALRGYPPPRTRPTNARSPLDDLHLLFEGIDPSSHNQAAVFIEALMTDAQLDFLEARKPQSPELSRRWLRVKLAIDPT